MELESLSRGNVAHLARREPICDIAQHVHLIGGHRAVRDLHPHHLGIVLALAVDAVLQAERAKVVAHPPALEKGVRLFS